MRHYEMLVDLSHIRDMCRGINKFKKGYQPRTNLLNAEKGNLLTDPHQIENRWMNYFCQLLNVQLVGGISRQKYRQQTHLFQSPASLRLRMLLES
jgi:hypothetical protein